MTWKCENCGNINPDLMDSCLKCSKRTEDFEYRKEIGKKVNKDG